jgi:uncharacterized protein (TIGR02271 family)
MSFGTSGGSGHQRMITAFFDSRDDAEEAIARLEGTGIARGSIRLVPGHEQDTGRSSASAGETTKGFWDSLGDLFLPDEDRHTYAEGLNRGGYLMSVNASDAEYERALDILDDEGTIDIEERAASWRSEGWTGASSGSSGLGATSATDSSTSTGSTSSTSAAGSMTDRTSTAREGSEVIPVAEEHLHVGKREVEHGRVRVRSYVVERPVEEQVSLREETVRVERRPVEGSRPTGEVSGDALFQERTIEVDEKREEAVVSKEARIKEELVVRKDVEQRTETISDTVRSTEVEVEDERGNRSSGTGTTDRKL